MDAATLYRLMQTPGTDEYAATQQAAADLAAAEREEATHMTAIHRVLAGRAIDFAPVADALRYFYERFVIEKKLYQFAAAEMVKRGPAAERYRFLVDVGGWVRTAESVGWHHAPPQSRFICYVPNPKHVPGGDVDEHHGYWGSTADAAVDAARAALRA